MPGFKDFTYTNTDEGDAEIRPTEFVALIVPEPIYSVEGAEDEAGGDGSLAQSDITCQYTRVQGVPEGTRIVAQE